MGVWDSIGKLFASTSQNADGTKNPYAGLGQSALSGLFGMMQAKGQSDDQNKLMQQQNAQSAANRTSGLQQSIMGDTLARDKMYADRNPIGTEQQYMQQQMLRDILLQKMMAPTSIMPINSKVREKLAASGYKPFTPELRSGWETGPSVFGKDVSLGALGTFNQGNAMLTQGRGPQTNLGDIYGQSPVTDRIQGEMSQYNTSAAEPRMQQQQWLQQAIDGEKAQAAAQRQKQGGGNIFGKVLKGVGAGLSFIPGVGQIAAPIATMAGGLVNGEGFKRSLSGAAMSAIPFGLGKLGGAIGGTAGSILGKVANPMNIGGAKPPQMIGQQAVGAAQGALGKAIQGNTNFYTGQYQQPQGQMNLMSRPSVPQTAGSWSPTMLPRPVNPSFGAR